MFIKEQEVTKGLSKSLTIYFCNRSEPELLTMYLSMKGQNSLSGTDLVHRMLIPTCESTHVYESIVVQLSEKHAWHLRILFYQCVHSSFIKPSDVSLGSNLIKCLHLMQFHRV